MRLTWHFQLISILAFLLVSECVVAEPWKRHTIDDSSRGADGVRLADVNGDGLMDIATGWEEGGVIRVYLNPGPAKASSTWPAVTVGKVKSAEDAVFADLDGDGQFDVVSCCEGDTRTIFVHWAPRQKSEYLTEKSWTTAAIPCTAKQQMWMFAVPIQIDGRTGTDLVVGSKGSSATIGWLESPTDTRQLDQWKFHPIYQAGWIMSLQKLDMDGDGDLDVLASDRKGSNRGVLWLENPGAAEISKLKQKWTEHRLGAGDREFMFLNYADLDIDGHRDVLCAVRGRGVSVFLGASNRKWRHIEVPISPSCGTGKGVAVGDIDGDGQNDVVFSCENASNGKSGLQWLSYAKSVGDPFWKNHEISGPNGIKFDRIELIDLDADGDLDVMTCEERNNLGVIWYENPIR